MIASMVARLGWNSLLPTVRQRTNLEMPPNDKSELVKRPDLRTPKRLFTGAPK